MDSIQISQLGKVSKGKLQVGEFKRVPAGDGKFTSVFKMTRKTIPLGNGVELVTDMPPTKNAVWLSVTAEAARRLGWPHPANKPVLGPADLPRLQAIVQSDDNSQQERLTALREIAAIDPERGRTLAAAYVWLGEG